MKLAHIVTVIVHTRLGIQSVLDLQTQTVIDIFKLLGSVAKLTSAVVAQSAKGSGLPSEFVALVARVSTLTSGVYSYITDVQAGG